MARTEEIQKQLDRWKQSLEKAQELDEWLRRAQKELVGVPLKDPRRVTYHEVEAAAKRLEEEIEQIEKAQEDSLTAHLEAVGPITIQLGDGTKRVLSARRRTAGGDADLLPADLLAVWRVAAVFGGSVETPIEFGDRERIDELKRGPVKRQSRKTVVTGEVSLFEK